VADPSRWDAALYDEKHSFVWKLAAGLLELLDARPSERILDVGCGTGHLTAQIAAAGAAVMGIDRSAEMIERARATLSTLSSRTPPCTGSRNPSARSNPLPLHCVLAGGSLQSSVEKETSPPWSLPLRGPRETSVCLSKTRGITLPLPNTLRYWNTTGWK